MMSRLPLLALVSWIGACATQEHVALVKIEEDPRPRDAGGPEQQLQRLEQLTAGKDDWRLAVRDILIALEAEVAENRNSWDIAARKWAEVLQIDPGPVASVAFQRWIRASEKSMASGTDSEVLGKLLLAETHEGLTSPWLQKQGLTQIDSLRKKIEEIRKGKIATSASEFTWPTDPSALPEDPFWEKAAQLACRREPIPSWVRWESRLPVAQKQYWRGLVAFCRKDYASASLALQSALADLEADESTLPLAINGADRLVQSQKRLGRREESAAAYRLHAKLLFAARNETLLGWSAYELLRRQVEAGLWVGRMQSLLGDYQSARIAVQQSIDQINRSFSSIGSLSKAQRVALDEQKADAYHILASRISYEQKDYAGALAFNRIAQTLPELGKEWRQRLLWSEGWYNYLLDDKSKAVAAWTSLLAEASDDQAPRLCYWIGRSLKESGRESEAADYFERLERDFPLNYYTVVALPRVDPGSEWDKRWLDQGEAKKRLGLRGEFQAAAYDADTEASRRLLRSELTIIAGTDIWSAPLSIDLYRYVTKKGSLLKELEASLYVTRLLFMTGQHLYAISMTSQLNALHPRLWEDFPEQILVFFPKPYLPVYQRAALQHYIEPELGLAISRQESSFQADAQSPAEAVGLMQLIVPTAERQASRFELRLTNPMEDLKRPDLNINLGMSYLAELGRRYRGQWPQAFAAYNAGEYVVDAWNLRRASTDPIMWIEGLSFGETSSYVKNVWRNWEVYRHLRGKP